MERVLATARSMQLRERGRVAEALAALLRNDTATEKLATARDRDRDGAGGGTLFCLASFLRLILIRHTSLFIYQKKICSFVGFFNSSFPMYIDLSTCIKENKSVTSSYIDE